MDWYSGGASKTSGDAANQSMDSKPAMGLSLMLRKLNLVTSFQALVLFFLP